ncbi:MAG: hypothetical protein LBV20_03055 [Treponema sp.]|jgi:hypothetical protein|nr:hypothetical protein [Treponema sp.]
MAIKNRYFILLMLFSGFLLFGQTNQSNDAGSSSYSFVETEDGVRFTQRITWEPMNGILSYDFLLDRQNENRSTYESFLQESTDKAFIELSLSAGMYRYKILGYNILGRLGAESEYQFFEVLRAVKPVISETRPPALSFDDEHTRRITLSGDNFNQESEVYLVPSQESSAASSLAQQESLTPSNVTYNENTNTVELTFDNQAFLPEDTYKIVVVNPGGLSDSYELEVAEPLPPEPVESIALPEEIEAPVEATEMIEIAETDEPVETESQELTEANEPAEEAAEIENNELVETEEPAETESQELVETEEPVEIENQELAEANEPAEEAAEIENNELVETEEPVKAEVPELAASDEAAAIMENAEPALPQKTRTPWDFNLSLGYAPMIPFYPFDYTSNEYHLSKQLEKKFYPLGYTARVSAVPFKTGIGNFGLELSHFFNYVKTEKETFSIKTNILGIGLSVLYQIPFVKDKFFLNIRLGGGMASYLGIQIESESAPASNAVSVMFPEAHGGISFQYFILRQLFAELGADFNVFFAANMFTVYISPALTFGWQF